MVHRLRLVEKSDLERRLPCIETPTLVLAGERDLLVSKRSIKQLCERVAHSQFQTLPGCGHLAFVSDPQRVAQAVIRFVTQCN
ncbi:MAG: hypothetical protein KatS3mg105_3829 [Gemmatales bacterium]|nr:MAG: hypothetical protein KatS3mg105_3829 [Gemmatales bacterium]